MRPATCGVTVTDSNAPLRPISLRYVGTSREAAREIVTDGAKLAGAAAAVPAFGLSQADVETSASAASHPEWPGILCLFTTVFSHHIIPTELPQRNWDVSPLMR